MHGGELTSIQKRKGGVKREEIYIFKQINIYCLSLKYAPPVNEPKSEEKVVVVVAKTFQKEETPVVHFCFTPMWLHISAPARSGRLGRGKRGKRGPSPGGVTAFCHTACSTGTTR